MSIFHHFNNIELTPDQETAISKMENFLLGDAKVFLLKGYAGTGKTTMLAGLIDFLCEINRQVRLMAPTGRAANVISEKTKCWATTIHSAIYDFKDLKEYKTKDKEGRETFKYFFKLRNDKNISKTVFLIDEASMISNEYAENEHFRFGSGHLLNDLVEFTAVSCPKSDSKIIFIGDPAQLPPVGMDFSPALDEAHLSETFKCKPASCEMTYPVRQAKGHILFKTTILRDCIKSGFHNHFDLSPDKHEIHQLDYNELIPSFLEKESNNIIITYKNRTAKELNDSIRNKIFGNSAYPLPGDRVIISRNNHKAQVLNGEFGAVITASPTTENMNVPVQGKTVQLRWRTVELLFTAPNGEDKIVKAKMLDNFLNSDDAALTSIEQDALYIAFKIKNKNLKQGTPEFKEAIKNDPYFNCILMKYGYAITCHKAQGGEWKHVFVVWDYNKLKNLGEFITNPIIEGKNSALFFRWAYTAATRTSKYLYNLCPPFFTPYNDMTFVPSFTKEELMKMQGKKTTKKVLEISLEESEELTRYDMENMNKNLQKKYFELKYLCKERYIEVSDVEHQPYQEIYSFKRENKTASIIFYYKKDYTFSKIALQKCNSEEFYKELHDLFTKESNIEIALSNHALPNRDEEFAFFPYAIDHEKPFLFALYNLVFSLCLKQGINIINIQNLKYRERYFFKRDEESAIIDFVYNDEGILTTAQEVKFNGKELILDVYELIKNLKQPTYALS